jgi:hypothetical protein
MGLISSRHAPWLDAVVLLAAQTTDDSHWHLHSTQRVYFCSGSAKPNVPFILRVIAGCRNHHKISSPSDPCGSVTTRSQVKALPRAVLINIHRSIHLDRSAPQISIARPVPIMHVDVGRSVSIVTSCSISYRLSLTLIYYNASVRNIQPSLFFYTLLLT